MIDLPDLTLCCVDTINHALALRALERSSRRIRFARAVLLTDRLPVDCVVPAGVEVAASGAIASAIEYSRFVLKSLVGHMTTSHVLLVQWDGYVIHPEAWSPAFLDFDYIGAKWPSLPEGMRVGNGGFSLRSRRLLEALQDPAIELVDNEDATICRHFRPLLERHYGMRFADEATADRFSFEMDRAAPFHGAQTLGFHGLFNFDLAEPEAELAALARQFPARVVTSLFYLYLMRNCELRKQWLALAALAERLVTLDANHDEARGLLATARARLYDEKIAAKAKKRGRLSRWLGIG